MGLTPNVNATLKTFDELKKDFPDFMAVLPEYIQAQSRPRIYCLPWLNGKARNVRSQCGEDGLLEAVLARIGIGKRWCFEVGAYDGERNSNVAQLIDKGWNAVLIECDDRQFANLQNRYADNDRVRCVHAYIEPTNIDHILREAGAPGDLDVGVIDIDEQDFWVWAGMRLFWPRIMVVEYGYGRPVDQVPSLRTDRGNPERIIQAGRNSINYLGVAKGYVSVAVTDCNVVFCRADLL